jgi:hypothetical protein
METVDIKRVPVIPGMVIETSKLVDRLKDGPHGAVLTDDEMTALIRRDTSPGGTGYGNLMSAIEHVIRNYRLVWHRIPNSRCIKCLSHEEASELLDCRRKHISRTTTKALREGRTVDVSALQPQDRTAYLVRIAQFGMLKHAASGHTAKVLESKDIERIASAADIQRRAIEAMK